ncbi:glucose-dependent insulinotropic receptor-like [Physella acuta]|uniref:glucose-dependent insulinotropic receptor-like n=1 Tax=Physella acuta TaxID=109671 RepID=UPI0027DBDE6B|nr:glucose-dependent insulinotropic receptor-like [Physella acuta]
MPMGILSSTKDIFLIKHREELLENTSTHVTILPDLLTNATCLSDHTNIHEQICHFVMIPVLFFIFLTNISILVYSVKTDRFRQPGHWFIASLYVSDLFVGVTSVGTAVLDSDEPNLEICLVRLGLFLSSISATNIFLLLIASDRFLAITRALTYHRIVTHRLAAVAITSASLVSLLVGFAPLFGWNTREYGFHCSFPYVLDSGYIIFMLTCSLLPIGIIFVIYFYLYSKARLHIKHIEAISSLHHQRVGSGQWMTSKEWKCIRQLMIVVGCLLVTWSPFMVATLLDASPLDTPCWLKETIGTHFLVLGMTNCVLNPLIYTAATRDFRRSFGHFVKHGCGRVT